MISVWIVLFGLTGVLGAQTNIVVTTNTDSALRQAINTANAAGMAATITFSGVSGTILLTNALPNLTNASGITITGPGAGSLTISGNNANRIFFVESGTVTISDLTLANGTATGGAGGAGTGGGGGGLGAGGALFVNDGATVTMQNIQFSNHTAVGGSGGGTNTVGLGGGGGGGLGGAGGSTGAGAGNRGGGGGGGFSVGAAGGSGGYAGAGGGGGLVGTGGEAGTRGGGGGGGEVGNGLAGGFIQGSTGGGPNGGTGTSSNNPTPTSGGVGGGGGGAGQQSIGQNQPAAAGGIYGGGGGGGGGSIGNTANGSAGGAGGNFAGGGGGGGAGPLSSTNTNSGSGASGGIGGIFGGGGGGGAGGGGTNASAGSGGAGGFGGGGGGVGGGTGTNGAAGIAGAAGFGGGEGGVAGTGGGGGSAYGGAVFVRQGGTLRILGGSISGGTLTAGAGTAGAANGSTEGAAIYLHTGTTLTYEVATAGASTIANSIGGAGALTKEGGGTLTLQGANTFTGITTVSRGNLVLTGSLPSNAVVDVAASSGAATFDIGGIAGAAMTLGSIASSANGTVALGGKALTVGGNNANTMLAGAVTGAGGSLIKSGTGTLTLSGANTFNGSFEMSGGKVIAASTNALGQRDVTLTSGTLQVQTNVIIGRDLSWASLATVAIDSVESGQFLEVARDLGPGTGVKTFDVTQSSLSENQRYRLLVATNLSSAFTTNNFSITIDPAFQYTLQIDENTLYIRLAGTDYTVYAQSPNQQQVATALNIFPDATSGDRVTVTAALNDLELSAYGEAFEQCMPGMYSSMPTLAFNTANAVNTKLFERLWLTRVGAADPGLSGGATETSGALAPPSSARDPLGLEPEQNWSTFLDGNGIFATANSGGAMSNYRSQSGGMTAGAMYKFMEGFDAGLYVGYQYLHSGYGGDSQLQDNAARFGLLGSWAWPGIDPVEETVWVNGLVGGAWHNYDVDRGIAFGTIDRTAGSTPGAGEFDLAVGTGYDLKEGNFTFGPAASVQYTYLGVQSFSETGADSLDLAVNSFNSSSCLFTLGGQAAYRWEVNEGLVITPMVSASWQYEFLQDAYTIGSAFNTGGPSSPFNYTTSAPERNFFYGGAGVSFAIDSRWQVIALWNCAAGNADLISQNVYLSLNAKF